MLKMLLDPMGGIVLTNDGNAILREIDVSHPAAKSMLELSRSQDEEVGDGTTSVIILGTWCLVFVGCRAPFVQRAVRTVGALPMCNRMCHLVPTPSWRDAFGCRTFLEAKHAPNCHVPGIQPCYGGGIEDLQQTRHRCGH